MKAVLLRDLKLAIRVGGGFGLAIMFFLYNYIYCIFLCGSIENVYLYLYG